MSLVHFIHACPHAKDQSQILIEILVINEYLNLIGLEPFLTIT